MEDRNLDLDLPLRRDQWEELGRRAAVLDRERGDFAWSEDRERISVFLREDEAEAALRNVAIDAGTYGLGRRRLAEFVYNGGRPYADLNVPRSLEPPAITPEAESQLDVDVERVVRAKWHELLKESGLHFEFGHVSPDVD